VLVSVSLSLPQSELALSLSLSGRLFDINTHLQRICRVYYLIGKHVLCVVLYIHIYIYSMFAISGWYLQAFRAFGAFGVFKHRENLTLPAPGSPGSPRTRVGLTSGSRRGHLARENSVRSHSEVE
jgi:hypothetical protein